VEGDHCADFDDIGHHRVGPLRATSRCCPE
jgi:hypothetical protein